MMSFVHSMVLVQYLCYISHIIGIHFSKPKFVGTFSNFDDNENEKLTLYLCETRHKRTYWSVIRVTDLFGNHIIGNGYFHKSNINKNNNIINTDCYFQINGYYSECTPSSFDISNFVNNEIILSFTFDSINMEYMFIKQSNNIINNENWNGYQCGIPWKHNINDQYRDVYPLAFVTEPFEWSVDGERDVEIYLNNNEGCWGYIKQNGESGAFYGDIFNRQIEWNGALYLHQWTDIGLNDPDDPCSFGSQISIRVDKDVLLIGFECSDGITGNTLLLYKTDEFQTCPVVD